MRTTALLTTLALVLGATGAAYATSVTTSTYSSSSVSSDIAVSCKAVSIGSDNGVLAAECNHQSASSPGVIASATSIDLDDVAYCKCDTAGQTSASLAWGTGANACPAVSYWPVGWSVSTDSTGDDYIVSASCRRASGASTSSSLDVGDTTDGLKNTTGDLEKR